MRRGRACCLDCVIALAALLMSQADLCAQGALSDDFESPTPAWRVLRSDVRHRFDIHDRTHERPHSGQWCERMQITGDNGSYIYMGHTVSESCIIAELEGRLWLQADRPGLQLLARVVFPRTIDPGTQRPAMVLVPGDSYTKVGLWQQLVVHDFPLQVERQARVLRTRLGPQVDTREAFVDQLVLNVYGGPGVTQLSVDDLELSGVVGRVAVGQKSIVDENVQQTGGESGTPERLPATWEAGDTGAPVSAPEVRLQGNVLLVGNKPFFPRMVQYRGESLEVLKRLGFNTVHLPTLPTIELLTEATQNDLWIVAPPPPASDLTTRNAGGKLTRIGKDFDRVLAWDLGGGLTAAELDVIRPWIKALRTADPRHRPILCQPDSELRAYSRYTDVLMVERRPLGTSQELNEYGMWLRSRGQLSRPGTPIWTTIQTQPTARLIEQLALLSDGQPPRLNWRHHQLRLLVITALAAGVRGICFESLTPLDGTDPETHYRAASLEWLNRELELIQPWTSGGVYVTTADCTDRQLVGVVLQSERARLMLPLAIAPHNQFAIDPGGSQAISFTVPGASESNDAYELSPAGLRPLVRRRVTGGLRITFGDGDRTSPIVMTQDPLVMNTLSRASTQAGRRMLDLQRTISNDELALAADVDRRLHAEGAALTENQKLLETARKRLTETETIGATNDLPRSQERARQATLAIEQLERSQWKQVAATLVSPLASPFVVSFQTLPDQVKFARQLAAARRGPTRLDSGDCESLDQMLAAGWKYFRHPQPGIATAVELSTDAPHGGQFCLHLKALAEDPKQKPQVVETPPMWVSSAPLLVEPGTLVEISGFVRVPKAIEGSVDGLMILDSITGDALAERIRLTRGWQPFTLYRAAPESGNLTITFALTGLGEASIDDVTIQTIDRGTLGLPQATRLPNPGSVVAPSLY